MIRYPSQNDLSAIGHVYCEGWKAAYRGIVPDDFLDRLTDENCSPRAVRSGGALVCERDGQIIGAASFGALRDSDDKQTGELYSIYVLPEYWSKGAGRALFDAACSALYKDGYARMFLWALAENKRALRFYRKMGMNEAGCRTITIGGKALSEVGFLMEIP